MKKTSKLILSLVLAGWANCSQAQSWNSAIEDGFSCRPLDATTSGISFIGGSFNGTSYFGASLSITLTSNATDGFLTRVSTSAGSSWAVKVTGTGTQAITKVELAGSSVLVYGTTTTANVTLYGTSGAPVTLTGLSSAFLARYTSTGVLTWAVPYAGNVSDMNYVPATGILYTIGADAASPNLTRIRSVNATTGALLYDVLSTNAGFSSANKGIAGDASNNVYILVDGTTNFKIPSSPTITLSATSDLVLMKLDATLTYQEHLKLGNSVTTNEYAKDVDCSNTTGDVYITGYYTLSSAIISSYTLTNSGNADLFLAKYSNATGTLTPLGATKIGGIGNDLPIAMSLDPNSHPFLLVDNQPSNSVMVDPCGLTSYTSSSPGFDNKWYMAKYTPTLTIDWSIAPVAIDATALPVAVQGQNGSANIFGYNLQQTDFGSTTLVGGGSIYITRASKCGPKAPLTTGINDDGSEAELAIYPNPTTGSVSIPLSTDDKNVEVTITDNLGKQVAKTSNLELSHGELNMETLPAGIYFYTIIKNNTSYKGKIVKQ